MPAPRSGDAQERADAAPGTWATMPAKMMKLMPLPMPRSVMSSPIHISRTVPAVSDDDLVSVSKLVEVEVRDDRRPVDPGAGQQDAR